MKHFTIGLSTHEAYFVEKSGDRHMHKCCRTKTPTPLLATAVDIHV